MAVADLRGEAPGTRVPLGQNFFIFMQFLGLFFQIVGWHPLSGVGTLPSGKFMDFTWTEFVQLFLS